LQLRFIKYLFGFFGEMVFMNLFFQAYLLKGLKNGLNPLHSLDLLLFISMFFESKLKENQEVRNGRD
jgi:hypothetical protein